MTKMSRKLHIGWLLYTTGDPVANEILQSTHAQCEMPLERNVAYKWVSLPSLYKCSTIIQMNCGSRMSGGADSSLTLDRLRFFVLEQKEQLKVIIGAKDREEGARGSETVKVQLRSTLVSGSTLSIPDLKIFMILC